MKHVYTNDKAGASRVVVTHHTDTPRFILVPPKMAKQLELNFFKLSDLVELEKLSSIVSRSDVKKFAWLNGTAFKLKVSGYNEANSGLIDLLNSLPRYYQPEQMKEHLEAGIKEGLDTLNSMIDSVNPEHERGMLEKVGYAAHQPMKVLPVSPNVYAVILYEVEVLDDDSCPLTSAHLSRFSKELKAACDEINRHHPLEVMCGLSLFNEYVKTRKLLLS